MLMRAALTKWELVQKDNCIYKSISGDKWPTTWQGNVITALWKNVYVISCLCPFVHVCLSFSSNAVSMFQLLKDDIAGIYGLPDKDRSALLPPGPLSFKQYCYYVATDGKHETTQFSSNQIGCLARTMCYVSVLGKWLDQCFLKVLRIMWGAKITVVKAVSLTEERFNHNVTIDQADLVVVYNEHHECGHYSAVRE